MKTIVCVKQVPSRDSALRLAKDGRSLEDSGLTFEMNEPDAYALEEALQLREKAGGEVAVLSVGPPRVASTIREALAKGADRAIHIDTGSVTALDALGTGRLIAAAMKDESPDLVLTGLQSDDAGYGQTGVVLAECLGFCHATIVMEVSIENGSVRVKRELEDGWFQNVTMPLPAVLTIQSGIKKLRYATLMGIKKAKTKELKVVAAAHFAIDQTGSLVTVNMQAPLRAKQTQLLTGEPRDVAKQLVEKLRFEARVI
ncbi:MAG: electron transfer flavoprotein subunit beta/FixA family protein [Bryobacteraceae bacterium]